MRTTIMVLAAILALGLSAGESHADVVRSKQRIETTRSATDMSAQSRRRPRVRIYRSDDNRGVYPSYFPGANAVRDCSVRYVQEFRPSGTVIVPRMNCFWRQP